MVFFTVNMAGSEQESKANMLTMDQDQDQEDQIEDLIARISQKKRPQKLPNSEKSDKVANLPRPDIALNCETSAKKRKLKRGFQPKPKDKPVVKNQVSKTV